MLPSSRSNGPAVVCHQMGLESEGKGGGVEEERLEAVGRRRSGRRRPHAHTLLKAVVDRARHPNPKQKQRQTCVYNVYITPLHDTFIFIFIILTTIYIRSQSCSCSTSKTTMAVQSLRSGPPSMHIKSARQPSHTSLLPPLEIQPVPRAMPRPTAAA